MSGIAVAVLLGGGVLGLFLGIALLAPRLVRPLARVVGWPAKRAGGVAGELAGANSVRNPGRTASTAAALMVGLTLVTVVAVLGAGLRDSQEGAVKEQLHAGYVIDGKQQEPFSAEEGEALARVPGVKAASHVRSDARAGGSRRARGHRHRPGHDRAVLPVRLGQGVRAGARAARRRRSGRDEGLRRERAPRRSATVSRSPPPRARRARPSSAAIYEPPKGKALLGEVSISQKGFDAAVPQPKNMFTFLDADDSAAAGLESAVADFGDASYHTGAAYPKDSTKDMATMLAMLYVLLGFSVIVSLFGMVNTLVLSVFERTRELGMLRTIGMTRRQARRMIRHESIITALIGAVLGLGLGVFLAALVTKAMSSEGLSLVLPVQTLAGFTLVAVLAGVAAAIMPARRASRLNVLDALHYE